MSSFVVEPKTISQVLTFLNGCDDIRSCAERELEPTKFSLDDLDGLGLAMYNLNCNAVAQRYPDCKSVDELPGYYPIKGKLAVYRYEPVTVDKFQALKSLKCWIYQCSEGNVPKTKLFQALSHIVQRITNHIINELPQYHAAEW